MHLLSIIIATYRVLCRVNLRACTCRYDAILSSILKSLNLSHNLPEALLEHVVTERSGSPGTLAAQSHRFLRKPGRGVETIDLLTCAASAGSVCTTQILIDCGAPRSYQVLPGPTWAPWSYLDTWKRRPFKSLRMAAPCETL